MGERKSIGENLIIGFIRAVCSEKDKHIQIGENVDLLHNFLVDKLIYVHVQAFDYNRTWFNPVPETSLKFRSVKGVVAL